MKQNHQKKFGLFFTILMVVAIAPLMSNSATTNYTVVEINSTSEALDWQTFERNMNVTTFVSPDGSKAELWHFLQAAEESIYVEIYGINNPRILDLIHEIHDEKPSLDMKFLIGWNSLGYPNPNKYVANNLTELGLEVKWTNSDDFTFAHQKYFIVDNKTTVIHSGNWAKTSFPEPNGKANREWSIAMTDVEVTEYYRNVFDGDWTNGTPYNAGTHGTGDALSYSYSTSTYEEPFATAGVFSGDMKVTPIFSPDTSLQGILYCINAAQATLDIQIPYFTSVGDEGAVDQILDAILAAKARGVTVRVITEEEKDWEEVEELLLEHDIPIAYQDTRWFTANHNKGIIADGRIVLISSINYSDGSITANREAGVIIENEDVASWYQDVYDFDWSIADVSETTEVNLYWDPNIPTSSSVINVSIYAHMLNDSNVDEVYLDYKINDQDWNNISVVDNIYLSEEDDLENYYYVIAAQADMTNITVVGRILVESTWHSSTPMVITVRNELASPTSPTATTSTDTSPTTTDTLAQLIAEFLPLIIVAIVGIVCGVGGAAYKKGFIGKKKRSSRRKK